MSAKKAHIVEASISDKAKAVVAEMARHGQVVWANSREIDDTDVGFIAEALSANSSVETFGIANNHITNQGALSLAKALIVNSTLQTLDLGENQIGDEGAMAFGEALRRNKTLRSLGLGGNKIKDAGAIALAQSLVGNTSLTSLWINHNDKITIKSVPALKEMIQSSYIMEMGLIGTFISDKRRAELEALLHIPIQTRAIPPVKKKRAAFIVRNQHDGPATQIRKALGDGEVFVDTGKRQHPDLAQLLSEIKESKTVVLLLLKKEVIEMPVCLIELNHAIVNEIPIVIVIDEEVNIEDSIDFVKHLETDLKEAGLELMKWCGLNVDEVGNNVSKMLSDASQNNTLKRVNISKGELQGAEIAGIQEGIMSRASSM